MSFRALLVTKDDQAAEVLIPVLSNYGLSPQCCGYSDAVCLVTEQKFQAVLVDYDDPHSAALVLHNLSSTPFQTNAVTVALLSDKNKVRSVFGAGANFILYKPVSETQALSTLRAATALIKRERRTAFRVPIQVAVELTLQNGEGSSSIEGILLDLSETGMDVLASQPLYPSARVQARFTLPNSPSELGLAGEVAWANPNGESGVRFSDTPESLHAALQSWLAENSTQGFSPEPEAVSDCRLKDLSLGACYIETASPFPERTQIILILRAESVEFRAQGVVRVMHPSRGMGVEFAVHTDEQRQQTEGFISFLTSRPGVQPELRVAPQALTADEENTFLQADETTASAEIEDALLDLLRHHESFSEDMFLQALRSQRSAEFVES
jgi:DNA-binding response OmpR family regulator